MRHAEVLCLIDHGKVIRRVRAVCQLDGQAGEQPGVRDQFLCIQGLAHLLKDSPQHCPLRLWQPGFATQPCDIAVVRPGGQLPGIDHLIPFGEQKMQAEFMPRHCFGCLAEQLLHCRAACQRDVALLCPGQAQGDSVERMDVDPLGQVWFAACQAFEFGVQSIRQRVGKRGEQHPGIGMTACQKHGPVQRHDGLAGARRPRYPRRAAVVALDPLALLGMQKDRPFLPRIVQGGLQFGQVAHDTEAALGIRVVKRVSSGLHLGGFARLAAGGQFQQCLGSLGGQVVGQGQQAVFGSGFDILQPLNGYAVAQQFNVRPTGKQQFGWCAWPWCKWQFGLHIDRHHHLLDSLTHLHPLRRPRAGVGFKLAALRPVISLVVVIHIAQQQTAVGLVNDDADVAASTRRPKVLVFGLFNAVQADAWLRRVDLQVKRRGFDPLLLVAGQACQAVGEGVGDAKVHQNARETPAFMPGR